MVYHLTVEVGGWLQSSTTPDIHYEGHDWSKMDSFSLGFGRRAFPMNLHLLQLIWCQLLPNILGRPPWIPHHSGIWRADVGTFPQHLLISSGTWCEVFQLPLLLPDKIRIPSVENVIEFTYFYVWLHAWLHAFLCMVAFFSHGDFYLPTSTPIFVWPEKQILAVTTQTSSMEFAVEVKIDPFECF